MEAIPNWRNSNLFTDSDKAILEYIEQSIHHHIIPDHIYNNLAKHFTTRQILDLNFTVSLCILINRFHATFQTDLDEETASDSVFLEIQPAYKQHLLKRSDSTSYS